MARRRYILSIDQGTTGSTVLLIDTYGEIVARGYCEFTQRYPHPGWVEHDAAEIWEVTRNVISNLVNAHEVAQQIAAIGLANQRETTVVWNRSTGKPIHPAIVWQCRRTSGVCEDLKARGVENCVRAKTGLVLDAYFSATKVAWILDSVDGARGRAERGELAFGTIDAWLLWNLTAGEVHATDYTNASRTMLFNIDALAWDDELLAEFRVPKCVLPEVQPSASVFGKTKNIDPLPNGIPISGIVGDQQAALFGQLCTQPPMAKNTYGTGCFLMLNTGDRRVHSKSGLLTTLACGMDEKPVFALEGSVFIAGAAIQWLRDGLQVIKSASETETIAASVADSGGVFVVPAFTGLGAPYWDANARGAILGLTRGTTRAHIVRATLESIAFQTADVVAAMVADAGVELDRLRVDGGAAANNLLMQIQADVLGIDVERPNQTETTGLGAGYCAGLTVGIWHSVKDLESHRKIDTVFSPQLSARQRTEKLEAWRAAVGKVLS
ncbi:MAG: glycerol kinase GlpK [Candidatus Poribacteria bacterium]|nr:glycerol kinase GlpK [Candidatus Poribacteria bacterium]